MIRGLLLLLFLLPGLAAAHETTRSYLTLTRDGAEVAARLRMSFRDVEVAVWLDADLDGRVTWGEAKARLPQVAGYATERLRLSAGGDCTLAYRGADTGVQAGVSYLDLDLAARCPSADLPLTVATRMFQDIDPEHRQLVNVIQGGQQTSTLLEARRSTASFDADKGGLTQSFFAYLRGGGAHLLGGADHVLFLIALMLPAVAAGQRSGHALRQVVIAISGFTLAHALSLTAVTLHLLRPPGNLVDLMIAVSIVLTAADNLRPFLPGPRAGVAAFFGIIHGFGFATALGALDLTSAGLGIALLGFNLGIEMAQIGVVLVVMPALYILRGGNTLLWGGSLFIGAIGLWWIWERMFVAALP